MKTLPVERNGGKTQHLGNLRNLSAKLGNEQFRVDARTSRYKLQNAAKTLLPGWAVDYCMEAAIPGRSVEIWQDADSDHAHIKGVARCGSVWTCPVCSAKIAIERRDEIAEALKMAKKAGYRPVMVTLTAAHSRDMSAAELVEKMTTAKRWMRNHGSFKNIKSMMGFQGSISSMEVTWGYANGWHFHFHEVFVVSKINGAAELKGAFFSLWERALSRVGLIANYERGVDVIVPRPDDYERVGNYIAKWGLESELSRGDAKEGKEGGHYSPYQLLAMYEQGTDWAGGLFQEYARATKGKTSIRWSRGLRDVLGLSKELTDKEAAEAQASENSYMLLRLTRAEYKKIIYSGRRGVLGELLAVAEVGRDALLLWLESVFDIMPDG
ncbi:MAG: hypothetical protein DRI56_13460 [Chloroflexota bacterium]|nr:MAG: hypothetical protein DRI56_13460 [Chloroflexota bacterium]